MWSKIDAAKSEILALSNDWIWKDEELKLAGIGNPDFLIKDILSDGVFRPFVPEGAIKRHNAKKILLMILILLIMKMKIMLIYLKRKLKLLLKLPRTMQDLNQ